MLARTYKTAEELNVAPDILEALEWLQGMLEDGVIGSSPYVELKEYTYPVIKRRDPKLFHFNFATVMDTDCGTVGCVGAWVTSYVKRNVMFEAQSTGNGEFFPALHKLFFSLWGDDPRDAKAAARRIDRFRQGHERLGEYE